MSLRSILASEGLIAARSPDGSKLAVMRKYKHPSLKASLEEFLAAVSTVYNEFEARRPEQFKKIMEDPDQFGGFPQMPLEFYAELIAATKRDDKAYWNSK